MTSFTERGVILESTLEVSIFTPFPYNVDTLVLYNLLYPLIAFTVNQLDPGDTGAFVVSLPNN